MTTKEVIIKTIGSLPDDVRAEKIITCIKSLELIKESDRQIDRGECLEDTVVMDKIKALL